MATSSGAPRPAWVTAILLTIVILLSVGAYFYQADTGSSLGAIDAQLDRLRSLVDERMDGLETRYDKLSADVKALRKRVNENTADVAKLQDDQQATNRNVDANTVVISKYKDEIASLQAKLATLRQDVSAYRDDTSNLAKKVTNLEDRLAATTSLEERLRRIEKFLRMPATSVDQ